MDNTILFGNGINRIAENSKSWDELLCGLTRPDQRPISGIPNTLQYEDLLLSDEKIDFMDPNLPMNKREEILKDMICQEVRKANPTEIHKKLAEKDFDHYLTTNYDYCIDKSLEEAGYHKDSRKSCSVEYMHSLFRKRVFRNKYQEKTVWSIHGEAGKPASIMLGFDHYCRYITKIDNYLRGEFSPKPGEEKYVSIRGNKMWPMRKRLKNHFAIFSWVDLFFVSNIHILGLGLDYIETDLWRVLNYRKRLMKETDLIRNSIVFHGNTTESHKLILQSLGVEVMEYPQDWTSMYQKMLKDCTGVMK